MRAFFGRALRFLSSDWTGGIPITMRPSLAAAALGMLSLHSCSAFLQAAPRHAARAALLQARGAAPSWRPQPLGRAGLARMMATVAPSATTKKLTNAQTELLNDVDVFIFDCDGVIWRGDSLIEKVPAVLEKLRQAGKRMFFVTNNSTKSRKGYKSKFTSLGLDVQDEEIFSSSFAAAAYLEQQGFKATGKKVYVIGESGIEEELDLIGVPHIGGPADKGKTIDLKPGYALEIDHDVGAVVVGFDRHFNYHKIQYAQLCINENKAEFIATNMDAVTHLTDAQEWAGAGSMVGAIKGCTGQEPTLVGKPSPLMIDYIVYKYQIPKAKICMVGDRLDTDVLFGKDNGLKTCLTLSGVTSEAKLLGAENKIHPDCYVSSIADFYPEL